MFLALFFTLLLTLGSASKRLPFDGLPADIRVIITKDGHSTPHSLTAGKHEDSPPA
jgi:hypothetical protein